MTKSGNRMSPTRYPHFSEDCFLIRLSANFLNRLDKSDKVTGTDQELDLSHISDWMTPLDIDLFILPSAGARVVQK